ncbi:sigma-70 family RNA polymerase sigma factor [Spirosoma agri]|uniref:Sigma-70 family RNA polymerase sigma factor n=1 Tax=Spirosoma agri TaxID=1987381 RepID=A0A6M0IM25_9BACT|nr:sigma-70 family RNA polymerase sigma factor [Spirosoma agri]
MNTTLINRPASNTKATERTQDTPQTLGETVRKERGRLLAFIRRRLPDPDEAEDVLQDVFVELTEAYQLAKPIERVASWLFSVARNKISDWYRKSQPNGVRTVSLDSSDYSDDDEGPVLGEWLAVADDSSPESEFFRETLMDALTDALAELPADQRDVFVQHELEGRSFKDMADERGVSVNTLLSRKRYAVLHLRERLQDLYDDFFDD